MKIYIASSWSNRLAVELLTDKLESLGHAVFSFVRVADSKEQEIVGDAVLTDKWVESKDGFNKFLIDINEVTSCKLVIYISPSGTDAWAEIGAAYANGIPIIGFWSKKESSGLMRHMVRWVYSLDELLSQVERIKTLKLLSGVQYGKASI